MPRLLSVLLMCVYGVCVCGSEESASKTALQRDYGVKLCGREFIRAVIFTCGGSRWKRSLDKEMELVQSGEDDLPGSYPSPSDRETMVSWSQSKLSMAKRPFFLSSSSSSLDNLLKAEEALRGRQHRGLLLPPRPLGGERFTNPTYTRLSTDRRKRNFSLGLAGMCCNQGCTKNDIGRLC